MPEKRRGSVSARLAVWFSRVSASRKRGRLAPRTSIPPRSSSARPSLARDEVKRGALLRRGLRQHERTLGEVERRERSAACHLRAALSPVEPARDHQVQDEKEPALENEDDPLPDAAQRHDFAPLGVAEGRRNRAQKKRAREAHGLETPADHARLERGQVAEDVRQLRHGLEAYSLKQKSKLTPENQNCIACNVLTTVCNRASTS